MLMLHVQDSRDIIASIIYTHALQFESKVDKETTFSSSVYGCEERLIHLTFRFICTLMHFQLCFTKKIQMTSYM